MKVYARKMTKTNFEDDPVDQDLGLVVVHNGKRFTLGESNQGKLILRAYDAAQLIIKPTSSNGVEIESE